MSEHDEQKFDLTLLSNFIHQIVNPLNGVIGTLDNLIDGTVEIDRQDQRLRAVRAQLEWTVVLIRNLAFFAGSASERQQLDATEASKTCVIPQQIIEAAIFFQEQAAKRDISVELSDKHTQYALDGPPDLLRQVFMNLIDNAVKYADSGTKIEIDPWVQSKTKTGNLIIEFRNYGSGFEMSERERLFELGYRSQQAKDRIRSGTGLGLYICRLILKQFDGATVEAEHSKASGKTVLRLRFPKWRIV